MKSKAKRSKATLAEHILALKNEAFMLMRFYMAFDRISGPVDLTQKSRAYFVDRLISLKALENDMIIRICKFGDKRNDTHSFNNAFKEIQKTHPERSVIKSKIDTFLNAITQVQKERRHEQLAHLAIGQFDASFEPCYEFRSVVRLIVEIIDLMNGSRINYSWKDGSFELYDLRTEVIKEDF